MHDIVRNELERHFSGDAPQSFYDHLEMCGACRAEVSAMDEVCLVLRDLKPEAGVSAPEPHLGFYNRVAGQIVENHKREAWSLFSPGAAFFRRIAFASLLVLASLGSFLVTQESSEGGMDAATIMAQHDAARNEGTSHSESADRDRILVTLASWRE